MYVSDDKGSMDERILAAASRVFTHRGPDAPVSAIAEAAGVGMSALYRRYPSKDDLLRAVSISVMDHTRRTAETAMSNPDAWQGFVWFIHACVAAGVDGTPRLVGSYAVTPEVLEASRLGREAIQALVDRVQATGELRADVNAHDIALLLAELRIQAAHAKQPPQLYERFLAIVIDGLHSRAATPLPTGSISWQDMALAWKGFDAEHSSRSQ
jgi:AcrR family transcriptional regulator